MIAEAAAAALICLDPGHGTPPAIGRQTEPIGPGSRVHKIKDGGGASGEAAVALAIAKKTRTLLLGRGYRVAMTRTASARPVSFSERSSRQRVPRTMGSFGGRT